MLSPSATAAYLCTTPVPFKISLSLALNTGCQTPCPDVPEFIKAHRRFSLSSRLTMFRTASPKNSLEDKPRT